MDCSPSLINNDSIVSFYEDQLKQLNHTINSKDNQLKYLNDYYMDQEEEFQKINEQLKLELNNANKLIEIKDAKILNLSNKLNELKKKTGTSGYNNLANDKYTVSKNLKTKSEQNKIDSLNDLINNQININSELRNKLYNKNQQLDINQVDLLNIQQQNNQLKQQLEIYKEELEYNSIEIKKLEDNLNNLRDENFSLKQQNTNFKKNNSNNNKKNLSTTKNNNDPKLSKKINVLESKIKIKYNQILKFKTKIATLNESLLKTRTLNKKKIVEIKQLKIDKKKLRLEIKNIEKIYRQSQLIKNEDTSLKIVNNKKNNFNLERMAGNLLVKHTDYLNSN